METLISCERALAIILGVLGEQPVEEVPLLEASGRTLATDIHSRDDIPPFANSAMDGYAVRVADLAEGVVLRVIEEIPAGATPTRTPGPGECARIMTGAPVPDGADAIVQVEWTERVSDDRVRVRRLPAPGMHVRPAGQDVRRGALVLRAGEVVTPPAIGMLATLGVAHVPVRRAPRVAVVATGDELLDPSEPLSPGKIRNSNGYALAAQVHTAGGIARPPLLARDHPEAIRAAIAAAVEADVLVFSGGVSVGDYDLVRRLLEEAGMDLLFWQVRQRPGKPLAFGVLEGKPVFGLPGNPVSSAMCFEQYVRPALAYLLRRRVVHRPRVRAVLTQDTAKAPGLHGFTRGVAAFDESGRLTVRDTGPQASNLYNSVLAANCIMHLPAEWEQAPAGTGVEIEWLTW